MKASEQHPRISSQFSNNVAKHPVEDDLLDNTSPSTNLVTGKTANSKLTTASSKNQKTCFQSNIVLPYGRNAPAAVKMVDVAITDYFIATSQPFNGAKEQRGVH